MDESASAQENVPSGNTESDQVQDGAHATDRAGEGEKEDANGTSVDKTDTGKETQTMKGDDVEESTGNAEVDENKPQSAGETTTTEVKQNPELALQTEDHKEANQTHIDQGGKASLSTSADPNSAASDRKATDSDSTPPQATVEENPPMEQPERQSDPKETTTSTEASDNPPTGQERGAESGQEPSSRHETSEVGSVGGGPSTGGGRGRESSTREKRGRRRSRRSAEGGATVPELRRRSSRLESKGSRLSSVSAGGAGGAGTKHLEVIILSAFQPSDPEGTGYVEASVFWEVLQSPHLNLQLTPAVLAHLQQLITPNQAGLIAYAEFASRSTDYIAALYANQPPAESHWVELVTADGIVAVNYNKQTGEAMEKAESGIDVFAGVIDDLYKRTDSDGRGYVTWKMFQKLLQSTEMSPFLQEQDLKDMKESFGSISSGKASYEQFYSLAKELILRVYRAKDPSDSPWCKISSPEVGEVWFNKFSSETHRGLQTGDSRDHEIEFISQAYAHVEEVNFELERYKEQCRIYENQLARMTEEQEVLATQVYDTGSVLDEANKEVIRQDAELEQVKTVIASKDQQIDLLQAKLDDMEGLRRRLTEIEQELQTARETVENRDSSITERDTNIMSLRRQADVVTDELKTAHGEKDAHDSALVSMKHQLNAEQKRIGEFEKKVPELEGELSSAKEQLDSTKHSLEEKTAALGLTRKHLKNARERNMFLEKEMEKLQQTHDKLTSAESEVRTLKTFLTTKTALIERHKKDLKETRLKVAELEEKDKRRAVILADVLEKTARQYQQQLGQAPVSSGGLSPRMKRQQSEFQAAVVDEARPYSAPAVPPEGVQWAEETDFHSGPPGIAKSFTTASIGPILTHSKVTTPPGQFRGGKSAWGTKTKNRLHTVPKLPPIPRTGLKQQRTRTFVFPTGIDLRRENKLRDSMLLEHTPSNPNCSCELCRMNASVVGRANFRPETGLTGMTTKTAGMPRYQGETDVRELALAEQLRIGQRVLVRMKKSEFDLEATKLTGIIKYVGKVDSEYVDHRIYVGVKLDEAVGDTDGLIKSKRYFTCPPKHGKLVRITNVVAVLPNKSVFYKSLQEISKRSPYTTVQKKLSAQV